MSMENFGNLPETGLHHISRWLVWLNLTDRKHLLKKLKALGVTPDPHFGLICAVNFAKAVRESCHEQRE